MHYAGTHDQTQAKRQNHGRDNHGPSGRDGLKRQAAGRGYAAGAHALSPRNGNPLSPKNNSLSPVQKKQAPNQAGGPIAQNTPQAPSKNEDNASTKPTTDENTTTPTKTVEFEETDAVTIDIYQVDPNKQPNQSTGRDVNARIMEFVSRYQQGIDERRNNEQAALSNLQSVLTGTNYSDQTVDHFGTILKTVATDGMKAGLKKIPLAGDALAILFSVATKVGEAHQNAAKASKDLAMESWLRSIIAETASIYADAGRNTVGLIDAFHASYSEVASNDLSGVSDADKKSLDTGAKKTGVVSGAPARLLKDLDRCSSQYLNSAPSVDKYYEQYLTGLATANSGADIEPGPRTHQDGTIYLKMKIYRDGKDVEIQDSPSRSGGKLEAEAKEKLVTGLNDSMKKGGKSVNGLAIPKILHLTIEDEAFMGNSFTEATVRFTDFDTVSAGDWLTIKPHSFKKIWPQIEGDVSNAVHQTRTLEAY